MERKSFKNYIAIVLFAIALVVVATFCSVGKPVYADTQLKTDITSADALSLYRDTNYIKNFIPLLFHSEVWRACASFISCANARFLGLQYIFLIAIVFCC